MINQIAEGNILAKIAETARKRVSDAQLTRSLGYLQDEWRAIAPKPKDFTKAFLKEWNVIAEVKKASPSMGDIAHDIDHLLVAQDYLNNGAAALSILTEPFFFKGKLEYLQDIRKSFREAYILQKDFIVDVYQIYEAALIGADSILLIVAMLGARQTRELLEESRKIGISALVEVHDKNELDIAIDIGATIIGVNNRNLKDMSISLKTSRELIKHIPSRIIPIAESGLTSHDDLVELKTLGYQGFLVGTQLMKNSEPGRALKELIGHGR
ncbi:MAG: indole-3-glycerol phosphate synthase TrpC [Chitinophagaceae bacterium]|nr:indole-3-glycerol phosphate synthase TrpC [Oligoflexus sp.]